MISCMKLFEGGSSKKGFSNRRTGWIRQAVQGDGVAIDLNGERGDYNRSFKGLRQGTLFSLYCST